MRILGIDPGTVVVGYGVIDGEEDGMTMVCCDTLKRPRRHPLAERLSYFYKELTKVMRRYKPEVVAVESPFVAINIRTALAIGKVEAIAILAAANRGIPTYEYSPAQVKLKAANHGASSKEKVKEMVKLHLGLDEIPPSSDAADALAVAICHLRQTYPDSSQGGEKPGKAAAKLKPKKASPKEKD